MTDKCMKCGTELVGRLGEQCPKCLLTAALESEPEPLEPLEGDEAELLAPGRTLVGRYTVLERIGEGGMSVVLAAYDSRLDRRVALKLLRPRGDTHAAELRARLVREAQAMARLSHPHVVHVYDAGALEEGSLFIAMEYVEGQTLRGWCEAQPRSWREVLQAWLAAGRGLAAAHEAGLIHRDFKPDNVLVGAGGGVRVTDFGLVRAGLSPESPPAAQAPELPPPEAWGGVLTWPGSLLGTPRYMAPELLHGQPADVRSDLYAWCVSLYEALYGRSPFAGGELDRRVEPPPADSKVPHWVTRWVLQGLEADPQRRPASMAALLAALEDDPEQRRRARLQAAALACTAALLAGLALGTWLYLRPDCGSLANRLAGVWDDTVRARARQAMLDTGLPYAQDTAERVSRELDDYARTWVANRTRVCQEVQAQGGVPQPLAALEEYCLERRLGQLRSLTELLARGPDKELLPKAVEAARSLPLFQDCMDESVLKVDVPPPEVRSRVEQLQPQVDWVETLFWTGKYREGLAKYEALMPQVEQVDYPPLQARARYWGARLREGSGAYKDAEREAWEALGLAARAQGPTLQARSWNLIVLVAGVRLNRFEDDELLLLDTLLQYEAEAANDDLVRIESLEHRGLLFHGLKRPKEAIERYERALALADKMPAPGLPQRILIRNNLGGAYMQLARYEEARKVYEQTLALAEKELGPKHPSMVLLYINLANVLKYQGEYEEARDKLEFALELQLELHGAEHPLLIPLHNNMGMMLDAMGRYEEALPHYERALTLAEKQTGLEHLDLATVLLNLCSAYHELGRHQAALEKCESARALSEKKGAAGRFEVAYALSFIGRTLRKLGRLEEAERSLKQSLERMEQTLGPKHPFLAYPLTGLAEFRRGQGRQAEAVRLLERALALGLEDGVGEVQFALARALWDSGKDRARALALATQALEYYQRLTHPKQAEVGQWLQERSQP